MRKEIVIYIDDEGKITAYLDGDFADTPVEITIVNDHYADDGEAELRIEYPDEIIIMGNDADVADADTVIDALVGEFEANHPEGRVVDTADEGGLLLEHLGAPEHIFTGDKVRFESAPTDNGDGAKLNGWFTIIDIDYHNIPARLFVNSGGDTFLVDAGHVKEVRHHD